MYTISKVIEELEALKKEHGDLPVCNQGDHEYWGAIEYPIEEGTIIVSENAQPNGPKNSSIKAVIFQHYTYEN
jgi:hypothetical protein